MPARPEALATYLVERAEEGLGYGTIDLTCSAIAYAHRQNGLLDPTSDALVRQVRRGLRRIMGAASQRQAHPLTATEIERIVSRIDPGTATGPRDRALILLGYASALRPGEIAGHASRRRVIAFRRAPGQSSGSKTDQDGYGQIVGVAAGLRARPPRNALTHWLAVRPTGDGPLFTRIHQSRVPILEPIGPRAVSRMIQARASAAGIDDLPVSGHSLRAGHATTAAANGADFTRIAAQTRHRDIGTLIEHYTRPSDALATTTSRDLGL